MKRVSFILLTLIVTIQLLAMFGSTSAYQVDTETSADNSISAWVTETITLLTDGFEGTTWDNNWNGNGTTTWARSSARKHTGTYSALSIKNNKGYLTSDNLNTSTAINISVSFWFYPKSLETSDIIVQRYNGTAYVNWFDLTAYPTYNNNQWCLFNEAVTDAQYFKNNFRLRFNTSSLADNNDEVNIDDVLITIVQERP